MSDSKELPVSPGGPGDIVRALETQGRVIAALLLRDAQTRYGMHKLGFLWALIEPAMMAAMFVLVLMFLRADDRNGIPTVPFVLCAILPVMAFRSTMSQMQSSLSSNLNMLGFPQVSTFDVIFARGLLDFTVMGSVFAFMVAIVSLLGVEIAIERPLEVVLLFLMVGTMALGLGFTFAVLIPIVPSTRQFTSIAFGRPLLLSSGVFYSADMVPMPFREWLLYNPLLHVSELMRSAFFVQFESNYGQWSYVLEWSVCLMALGLVTHQALRRRAVVGL